MVKRLDELDEILYYIFMDIHKNITTVTGNTLSRLKGLKRPKI